MQKSRQELCKFTSSSQDLSIIYLRVVNSHQFNQSDLDTRSWYHGMAASKECLQAPLHTPCSPDRSLLALLVLDYTRLSRPKPNREPVLRLCSVPLNKLIFLQDKGHHSSPPRRSYKRSSRSRSRSRSPRSRSRSPRSRSRSRSPKRRSK